MKFKFSTMNKVGQFWRVFYKGYGMGFDTGSIVGVGHSDWSTEASAIESREKWERQSNPALETTQPI
jgi:hypothetical protein